MIEPEIKVWPIQVMRIVELRKAFAPYNPRVELKEGMSEWTKIVNSIKKHGFADFSIVYNTATKTLVGGHQRVKILEDYFHLKEIPTVIVDITDLDQEKAMNLALNHAVGLDDIEKTKDILKHFIETCPKMLEYTGYDKLDIKALFKDSKKVNTEDMENLGKFNPEEEFDCRCPRCQFQFNMRK